MADKETLTFEVDSNIKAVTKDQKAWNKEIKKTEDSIKDVNKEGKEVVAEMQVLGLSINGLKAGWKSAASGAKFMFRSIKMGIISTGIGVFVVAFGTLATWFAKTKKGAEFLEVAFAGIGAAINVIVDRIAKFGGGIAKILSGNVRAGLKDMGDSFKGIGEEILTDTLYTMALKKEVQSLTDSQRALNVETAQRRADIEELKLIAEDVTKSEKERLKAAKDAFGIENELLNARIDNAEKALILEQKRQSTILDPQKEDLDIIAQKEIDLANIRAESGTKQIELNNKINSIEAEVAAARTERHIQRLAQIAEEQKAFEDAEIKRAEGRFERAARFAEIDKQNKLNEIDDLLERETEKLRIEREAQVESMGYLASSLKEKKTLDDEFALKEIALAKKVEDAKIASDEAVKKSKQEMTSAVGSAIGALGGLMKEGSAAAKAAALTEIAINTGVGFVQGLDIAQKSAKAAGPGAALAFPIFYAMQVAAVLSAAAQAKKILGAGGGGGGGAVGGGGAAAATPAPQMMSGAFDLTGGVAPEPVQAFVLTDEMTNSQNQLANIRRRATI